jgi:hypothetical protein
MGLQIPADQSTYSGNLTAAATAATQASSASRDDGVSASPILLRRQIRRLPDA